MSDQPSGVDEQGVIGNQVVPQTQFDQDQQAAVHELSDSKSQGQLSMNVKVYSPFHDYYDGPAYSLTAANATGPFDILPKHHNFISLLDACDLVIRTTQEREEKISIAGGLMRVKADQVIVFLDV